MYVQYCKPMLDGVIHDTAGCVLYAERSMPNNV